MALLKYRGMTVKINGFTRNNGLPYYQRAVPKILQPRYGKSTIKIPLKANSDADAAAQCKRLYESHTALFEAMRGNDELVPSATKIAAMELLAIHTLKPGDGQKTFPKPPEVVGDWDGDAHTDVFSDYLCDLFDGKPNNISRAAMHALRHGPLPTLLSEAFQLYITNHEKQNNPKFVAKQFAYWNNLISFVGDTALEGLTREDAKRYRDHRLAKNLKPTSVVKEIGVIKAILNSAITELSLNIRNPFEKITVAKTKDPEAQTKSPYSKDDIRLLVKEAEQIDDEKRRIVLVLAVTGARLSEIVGLRRKDVDLDLQVIHLRDHVSRSVKTKTSNRDIPLLPTALKALTKQLDAHAGDYVFPSYSNGNETNGNSASAALNKWAKKFVVGGQTMHSFRHSLRDNLRAVECPEAIAKEIGGWASGNDVSVGYGRGYSVEIKRQWLARAYVWL